MRFYAYHGVSPQERQVGNTYTIDLKVGFDMRPAFESDQLSDTLNYAAIYAAVAEEMAIPSSLIEHVAARILRRLRKDFPLIETLEIRLAKRNPPFDGDLREAAVHIVD
jgi:dihydroneopterin aldolase